MATAGLAAGCGGGGGGGGTAASATTAPHRTTTTIQRDDRYVVAYALPDVGDLGAGWVELNRDPGGRDDPTLPTAPEIGDECGGRRSVHGSGTAFALFERRRISQLDEQLIVYTMLFEDADAAGAQAALYRSATYEGCLVDSMQAAVDTVGAGLGVEMAVDAADRPLPALADGVAGVAGAGRHLGLTMSLNGVSLDGAVETTVLQDGRALAFVLRFVVPGAPEPFTTDRLVKAVADGLAYVLAPEAE